MQFFTSFCVGCVLIGALYIICPDGSISKTVKYLFSLIFLIIIISAANIPLKNINLDVFTSQSNQIDSEGMQISAAEYVFSHTLKSQNINFSKISIFTDKTDDQSIVITKVVIVTNEPREKVINALGELAKNREVEIMNE